MRNVVVGVNGTEASARALDWAVETVGPNGHVHVAFGLDPWTVSLLGIADGAAAGVVDGDVIGQWTAHVADRVGELTTSFSTLPTARVLDEVATRFGVDAIVVGSHVTMKGFPRRIGRTTNHLLRSTAHPVVVVPPGGSLPLDDGRIVVGVGHGNATRGAVRFAAALAQERHLPVELLHAVGDAPIFQADGVLDLVRYQMHPDQRAEQSRETVLHFAELMQTITASDLAITATTAPGLAALRIDEASERSSLLVIGRHRSRLDRGRHTAQPLRHALTHARCPVAVIADHPDDDVVAVDP